MNWIKQLFSRRSLYDNLSEEIQEHLDERIEDLVAVTDAGCDIISAKRSMMSRAVISRAFSTHGEHSTA